MGIYGSTDIDLIHWGVKGMKWGVRRYQNRDGSLTAAGKQRLAEKQIRTEENLSEKTISKGTKMYRVTPDKTEKSSKSTYVTYLDEDRDMYKNGTLVRMYRDKGLTGDSVYEHEFELKTDVRIPSLKTVREVEKRVITDNKKAQEEVARAVQESFMMTDMGYTAKDLTAISGIADRVKKSSTEEQRQRLYKDLLKKYDADNADFYYQSAKDYNAGKEWVDSTDFLTIEKSLGRATNVKNSIINELKKLGYNAMYDNASIGVQSDGGYSKEQEAIEPLIIFDSDATLKNTNTRFIDRTERYESNERYNKSVQDRRKALKNFK